MDGDIPKHIKRAVPAKDKRFGIEMRFVGTFGELSFLAGWRHWRWYATRQQRDEAMKTLQKKSGKRLYRPVDR
jgi:hypothetical protein